MLDPRLLRDDPERIADSQRRRGEDAEVVAVLVELDRVRRQTATAYDELRAAQKQLSKRIGPLQGAVRRAGDEPSRLAAQAELDRLLAEAAGLADQVKHAERAADSAAAAVEQSWRDVSNLVEPDAPVGGEDDFALIEHVGTPRDFAAEGFVPRDHLELGELLGAIDVERAAKVSGSRFYYLTGVGALLELALVNLAMTRAVAAGFVPVIPPVLVSPKAMAGTGFLGQAAENVYHLEADDLYLVGTAEVPLAAYHSDEILDADTLPRRYAGFSPCFRREAGSHGKDTRGIIRVHQFDKVEMFSFCDPADAPAEHRRLLQWEKEFLDLLELPYRVIDVATGDLGASAARKFDIEAWIPTQGRYREVTSASNCTDFQARRLQIRTRGGDGSVRPLATLNGTLCALPRTIVAILENHQLADGSVAVPVALQPFLAGRTLLEPVTR
ncbi:MAG: serine--tRNA ligase [Actinomycetota bacterium]|nr:MAG: serine--tRNA ligase [Actinomycetota bacterium]